MLFRINNELLLGFKLHIYSHSKKYQFFNTREINFNDRGVNDRGVNDRGVNDRGLHGRDWCFCGRARSRLILHPDSFPVLFALCHLRR